jgi:hypothetical protein
MGFVAEVVGIDFYLFAGLFFEAAEEPAEKVAYYSAFHVNMESQSIRTDTCTSAEEKGAATDDDEAAVNDEEEAVDERTAAGTKK